jgi:hypothetical protein
MTRRDQEMQEDCAYPLQNAQRVPLALRAGGVAATKRGKFPYSSAMTGFKPVGIPVMNVQQSRVAWVHD